jgi:DNA gyrase/topoisomerase IV subunit A
MYKGVFMSDIDPLDSLEITAFQYDGEAPASDIIKHNMTVFANAAARDIFANSIDGLKKVHRRILLTMGKELRKVSHYAGSADEYHPAGDSSVADAIKRLAQATSFVVPLLDHHGDVGSYHDPEGAQARYVEAAMSDFAYDMYINNTHRAALKLVPSETDNGLEVQYFIPVIPMALVLGVLGIVPGFRTICPPMDINNVCELAIWYIDHIHEPGVIDKVLTNKFPKEILHLFLPQFPTDCRVRNKKQLLDAYAKGDFEQKIIIDGDMRIQSPSQMVFHNLPIHMSMKKSIKRFMQVKKAKSAAWVAHVTEESDQIIDKFKSRFTVKVKKTSDVFDIGIKIARFMGFYGTMSPDYRWVTKEGFPAKLSPGQILHTWYEERYRALIVELNKRQNELAREILRIEGLLVITQFPDEIIDIFKNGEDNYSIINTIMQQFKLSRYQAEEISKMRLSEINRTDRAKLALLLDTKRSDFRDLVSKGSVGIRNQMKDTIRKLQAKYMKNVRHPTIYPNYVGHVKIHNSGIIFLDNLGEDLWQALRLFNVNNLDIVSYEPMQQYQYVLNNNKVVDNTEIEHSKYTTGELVISSSQPLKHTVVLNEEGDNTTVFTIPGLHQIPSGKAFWVGDKCLALHQNGNLEILDINKLPVRKSANALGVRTTIINIINGYYRDMVVFYMNPAEPNTIRVERVLKGRKKLSTVPMGVTELQAFSINSKHCLYSPPTHCLQQVKKTVLMIPDMKKFMGDDDFFMIELKKSTPGIMFQPYKVDKRVVEGIKVVTRK